MKLWYDGVDALKGRSFLIALAVPKTANDDPIFPDTGK